MSWGNNYHWSLSRLFMTLWDFYLLSLLSVFADVALAVGVWRAGVVWSDWHTQPWFVMIGTLQCEVGGGEGGGPWPRGHCHPNCALIGPAPELGCYWSRVVMWQCRVQCCDSVDPRVGTLTVWGSHGPGAAQCSVGADWTNTGCTFQCYTTTNTAINLQL